MLMSAQESCLLLVDVQEKLTPFVMENTALINNCHWLLRLAKELNVVTVITEQYPKGLGNTVSQLQEVTSNTAYTKVHFSCAGDKDCMHAITATNRNQIIIIGIEAHVCVLQTAIELQLANKQVFVVADAVSSRHNEDKAIALARMQMLGIQIVTKEMVFFEWLRQAGTAEFKRLSQEFMKN